MFAFARCCVIAACLLGLGLPSAGAEVPPVGLADLVTKLLPQVVNISFVNYKDDKGNISLVPQRKGVGTGYVVDERGVIATNRHVTDGGSEIYVSLADGTRLRAELIYRSPDIDLALLRVKPSRRLPVVAFGDSDLMRQGDQVIAIGNPLGLSGTVTTGIISARDRDIHETELDSFMQIDASINPGNSGGPLFNAKGEVIGMNTALYSVPGASASGSIGLNFAIPINDVVFILESLRKYGKVRNGFIGAYLQNITPELANAWGLPIVAGAIVTSVQAGGPAAAAKLQPGDILKTIGTKQIENLRGATRIITATPATAKVAFVVLRDGHEMIIPVDIGETKMTNDAINMAMEPLQRMRITAEELGVDGEMLNPELRTKFSLPADMTGVVLTKVTPGGLGAYLGLSAGIVVRMANGAAIKSVPDLLNAAQKARAEGRNSLAVLIDDSKEQSWLAVPIEAVN